METTSNFKSGDWVILKHQDEIEIYRVECIYLNSNKYNITQLYSDFDKGKKTDMHKTAGFTYKQDFNCDYPTHTFNRDARLVSEKLIRLLYD